MLKDIINSFVNKNTKEKSVSYSIPNQVVSSKNSSVSYTYTSDSTMVSYNMDGIEAEKKGDLDTAIKLYEKNVSNRFDGSHPYKRLAIIYRKQKRYEDEIRVLETAIDVFSKLDRQDVPPKLQYFRERLVKAKELLKKVK